MRIKPLFSQRRAEVVTGSVISSGFDVDHSAVTTTHPLLQGVPVSMRKKYGIAFEVLGI